MEFFRGKTLIFKEFFRGEQRFHGIFREKSTFSRISSGVHPFLREVFRGDCSLVEFFRGKKKSYSSTGGVRILNAIAQSVEVCPSCVKISLFERWTQKIIQRILNRILGSVENEALENEDRSTKHSKHEALENEALENEALENEALENEALENEEIKKKK